MSPVSRPTIYPRYCFHLSPTVNTWCLLRVSDIHALDQHAGFQGENFFFHRNLPIKWVRIVGVVVAVDDFAGRRVYTVDDSSGACIEATHPVAARAGGAREADADGRARTAQPAAAPAAPEAVDVGDVVDIKGALSTFRDEKQIEMTKLARLTCTAQEVAMWDKRTRFRRDVLDKPWLLDDRDIRRCRREAERSAAAAERRKTRGRSRALGAAKQVTAAAAAAASQAGHGNGIRGDVAGYLKDMIRGGALAGKYDALGL
ncbi:hypothetical protein CDD83_7540 [Cordyceps sp. RAO-2017]|nr:hypothetical protein CDD83_7540 [Cordyceps sp. RAO-2017]